jgi:very-short-patch-repair endonuclease
MRLTRRAIDLRSNSTDAERRLWYCLRDRRFMDLKFRRQVPIASYIVDFLCLSPPLVIELDGGQHAGNVAYDRCRDECLRRLGFQVLRFWNHNVLSDTAAVLESIRQAVVAVGSCNGSEH